MLSRSDSARLRQRVKELHGDYTYAQMAQIISEELGAPVSVQMVGWAMRLQGLKSGRIIGLPPEAQQYILEHYKGVGPSEMTERVIEMFGCQYDVERMKGFYSRHRLNSGVTGRFERGFTPWNKGTHYTAPGTERTRFRKGHRPSDWRPVGSERIDCKDGYILIKVAEPNKWELKHRVVWRQHNGPIPKGHVIIFRDQNKYNLDPQNLVCVSRGELGVMCKKLKFTDDPDINDTKLLISKVILKGARKV